ncbi:MAG: hypothetical protein GC192_15200 [Bacteroidetes bacterium]|nr:hypothetical protein [Bacteroidota bacterium]
MKKKSKHPSKNIAANPIQVSPSSLKQKLSFLKFLAAFVISMGLFYFFYYSDFYTNTIEVSFMNAQASLGNFLLHLIRQDTVVNGYTISGNGFSIDIKKGCDGLEAMAILASGIIIFPTSVRLKVPGLVFGIIALFLLNLLRIAGLYMIGKNCSNDFFEIMHFQGGFIIFTAIGVLFLLSWMNWTTTKSLKAA